MVWLSSIIGILQLFVVLLLVREVFGIRYDTGERGVAADGSSSRGERDRPSTKNGQADDELRRRGDRPGNDAEQAIHPSSEELDHVADDEESLRLTFDDIEDVSNNILSVFDALKNAIENESFDRAQALAAQGADLVTGESSRSKSVASLLDQRSDLVKDATNHLEEVKERLEENLVRLSEDATVEPMANMHESRADGLFYSNVKALEKIPDRFFREKLEEYKSASSDEERVTTWKEAYQVLSQLPQFYQPDWTNPKHAEDAVGKTVRVDGEERNKLRHELERMIERYDLVREQLPDAIEADESHREAEQELNLVHEALNIIEQHQRLLEQIGENDDAGDVTVGKDDNDNPVSLRAVAEKLGNQFRSVYQGAQTASSADEVDVSQLEELLQVFIQSVNQVHRALELYTSRDSTEDTIEDLKGVAQELREQRRQQ